MDRIDTQEAALRCASKGDTATALVFAVLFVGNCVLQAGQRERGEKAP